MKKVAAWILIVFLTLLFAPVGGMKLLGVSAAVKEFDMIGSGSGSAMSPEFWNSAAQSGCCSRSIAFGRRC